jgi:hypothetical protein
MSSPFLRPTGSKTCRLVQFLSYVVVDFPDDLGMEVEKRDRVGMDRRK